MNIFIDTEFNGYGGRLISMALIDADGREFYAAPPMPDQLDPWVQEHVVPVLDITPMQTMAEFQAMLEWWLSGYEAVHIVADWPDDIKHFCDALITGPGTRLNTPALTMEVRRDLDAESLRPHNALEDVRAIRKKAMCLPAWERPRPQPTPTYLKGPR